MIQHNDVKKQTSWWWFTIVKLQFQSKKFEISIAYFAYIISFVISFIISFVISFIDLSSFWNHWKLSVYHFNTWNRVFQVNTNVIIYTSNFLSKLWKRTLIQNENEIKRRWRLRKTEKAINKTTIIIHSCLCFIISTTQFNQKINNVYASFTRRYCCHLRQLHIIYTVYNVIYMHYN